jgi:hypothetical protein
VGGEKEAVEPGRDKKEAPKGELSVEGKGKAAPGSSWRYGLKVSGSSELERLRVLDKIGGRVESC